MRKTVLTLDEINLLKNSEEPKNTQLYGNLYENIVNLSKFKAVSIEDMPFLDELGVASLTINKKNMMNNILKEWYAEKVILVMDNLNTHKTASLYKRYPADEARRIIKRLEIHYTPKHGSWLDIAEIELNVMTRQCLSRRIENIAKLRGELAAWEVERNTVAAKVNWQFRTADARVKLSSLYPMFTTASE